ncbi:MAG: ABC transporter substrate-binding protein [Ilumatobacteraceae bacterium]
MRKSAWAVGAAVLSVGCASVAGATTPPAGSTAAGGTTATAAVDLCSAAAAGPISIVHLTDVKGESPTAIDDFFNGSQMAVKEINDKCGKEVVTLERIPTDFSAEAFEAKVLEAQEKKPTVIIGQGSSSQMSKNSLVTEGGIPTLWPVGTASALQGGENYSELSWMLRVVNDTQGQVWGKYVVDAGFKKAWLECVTTQLGVSGCGAAEPILKDAGVEVIGRADSATDATDFTNSVTTIKDKGGDVVVLAQFPRPTLAFAKAVDDNGLSATVKLVGSTSTELIYQALSPTAQNAMVALADCNPLEDAPDTAAAYLAAYQKGMTSLAAVTYDGVYLTVDAVARMGSTAPAKVAEGIASTHWDGVCQTYSDSGSHALAHHMVVTSFGGGVVKTEKSYDLDADGKALAG